MIKFKFRIFNGKCLVTVENGICLLMGIDCTIDDIYYQILEVTK